MLLLAKEGWGETERSFLGGGRAKGETVGKGEGEFFAPSFWERRGKGRNQDFPLSQEKERRRLVGRGGGGKACFPNSTVERGKKTGRARTNNLGGRGGGGEIS